SQFEPAATHLCRPHCRPSSQLDGARREYPAARGQRHDGPPTAVPETEASHERPKLAILHSGSVGGGGVVVLPVVEVRLDKLVHDGLSVEGVLERGAEPDVDPRHGVDAEWCDGARDEAQGSDATFDVFEARVCEHAVGQYVDEGAAFGEG